MKREDLKKLEISDEAIDKIMALHGADITKHQTAATTAETERDALKTQLAEAGATIESFKKLDVDGIKAAADEWKHKAEQAATDAAAQVAALKFDHALDGALTGAKAKNAKAVKALLEMQNLKLNDADGSIIGLEDQLKAIKEKNDYLFADAKEPPRIVAGGEHRQSVNISALEAAVNKGGGFKQPQ